MNKRKILHNLLETNKYPKQIYIDLFNILSEGSNYTSNSNGIFFNLSQVREDLVIDALGKLSKVTENLEKYNKSLIEEREKKIEIFKNLPVEQKTKVKPKEKKSTKMEKKKVVNPFFTIEYKGVYKRLDSIIKGRKQSRSEDLMESEPIEDLVQTVESDQNNEKISESDDDSIF